VTCTYMAYVEFAFGEEIIFGLKQWTQYLEHLEHGKNLLTHILSHAGIYELRMLLSKLICFACNTLHDRSAKGHVRCIKNQFVYESLYRKSASNGQPG